MPAWEWVAPEVVTAFKAIVSRWNANPTVALITNVPKPCVPMVPKHFAFTIPRGRSPSGVNPICSVVPTTMLAASMIAVIKATA